MEEQEIDLLQLWEALKKRWIIVVVISLIATLTAGIVSFFVLDPVYEASTTLIVGKKASDDTQQASQLLENNVLQANKQLALTYSEIAKSRTVEENVIRELGLSYSTQQLDKKVTVESVKNTEILEIAVLDKDPALAADIANTMARKFSDAVIDIKKVDSVSIVDKAVPPVDPVKPKKMQNIMIAFAAGLLVSLGLALLLEFLDNTIKSSKDIDEVLGLPVLGEIPIYETDKA